VPSTVRNGCLFLSLLAVHWSKVWCASNSSKGKSFLVRERVCKQYKDNRSCSAEAAGVAI